MAQYGLLTVLNNAEVDARNAAAATAADPAAAPAADQYAGLVDRLSSHLESAWQAAKMANDPHHREMLADLRQRNGEYDPEKLEAIKEDGGSDVFMQLSSVKCRAAESWIRDSIMPNGDERPFSTEPTPIPELPPEIADQIRAIVDSELAEAMAMGLYPRPEDARKRVGELRQRLLNRVREEAKRQSKLMEDEIDDHLVQGDFYQVLEEAISDFVTLPAAIIKGPVVRKKKKLKWRRNAGTGGMQAIVEEELMPFFYRVSPLDLYPSPGARHIGDGPLIEHVRFRREALAALRGVPGYSKEKIDAALTEYRDGYLLGAINEQERRDVEGASQHYNEREKTISALEFHCSVPGSMLIEWGMEPERVPDPQAEYQIIALKVGRFVVRCVINEDPLGRMPYHMESFERINDSFWGRGVPRLMRDLQAVCNACARSLVNNMAYSSGPFMEVEVDRLAAGQEVTDIHPRMILQTKASKTTTPAPAVRFHQPNAVADVLLRVFEFFSRLADDYTGIPAYSYGSTAGANGAAATASGMSMMLGNAARGIKRAISRIDRIISGAVTMQHHWIMLYKPDTGLHGDIEIRARGAASLVAREQMQLRKTEFLKATANPIDAPIIGPDGRARLLREVIKDFDIPVDEIVPDKEEAMRRAREAMMQELQAQGTPENPAAMAPDGSKAGGLNLAQEAV